jgi:uncharacterized protein YhhL (DUF1145 family)
MGLVMKANALFAAGTPPTIDRMVRKPHPLHWVAELLYQQSLWVYRKFDIRRLMIASMAMIWVGIILSLVGPFTSEPLLVFLMSALALVFGGVGTIASIMTIIKDTDEMKREIEK